MLTTLPASTDSERPERRSRPVLTPIAALPFLLFFTVTGAAQAKHRAVAPARADQEISWQKWRFAFTAPSTWRLDSEYIENNKKVPNGAHTETRYYNRAPDRSNPYPHTELTIVFTTWPGPEFTETSPSGQTLTLSLEDLFALEQGTPDTWKPQLKNPQFEAVRYETLDGVRGVLLQRSDLPVTRRRPTDKLVLDWNGYRIFDGNLQRISAALDCTRAELPRALTILRSFQFSK